MAFLLLILSLEQVVNQKCIAEEISNDGLASDYIEHLFFSRYSS
jgi:hypothetical protein